MSDTNPYAPPRAELSAGAGSEHQHSPAMVEHLRGTGPWVRGLAVLGFVCTGLIVLGAVVSVAAAASEGEDVGSVLLIATLYLLMAALYLLPTWRLNRYADAIVEVAAGGGTTAIELALSRQRTFWRGLGMTILGGVALGGVALLATMLVGVIAG